MRKLEADAACITGGPELPNIMVLGLLLHIDYIAYITILIQFLTSDMWLASAQDQ